MRPEAYEARLDPDLASMVPDDVRVVRVPAWSTSWTRRAGIGDLGLRAFANLRRACNQLMARERFDALFVTTFPIYPALLGPMLKRRFRVPFVLDFQDPWVGSWGASVGGGTNGAADFKSRASRRLATLIEPIAVGAADGLTAVSTATYEDALSRVAPPKRPVCATLPLGWESRDFERVNGAANGFFDPRDGCVHLCYVGTLLPNGLDTLRALLGAARLLRESDPLLYRRLRLRFFGTSNQSDPRYVAARVTPVAEEIGVGDIVTETPERIPYLAALGVLKQATGILLLGSSEPHYTASKLYPALLAERPILAIFHEESSVVSILRRVGRVPSVRLMTYGASGTGRAPEASGVVAALRALTESPVYDPLAVDPSAAADVSAAAIARQLGTVLDDVCRR
jgi:hypothetical protein